MKKIIILLALGVIAFGSCTKKHNCKIATDISDCIREKTEMFCKSNSAPEDEVIEFILQNETVYAFNNANGEADGVVYIYNSECEELGYLGGYLGIRKINGVVFSDSAIFVRHVWKKANE